MYPANLPNLVKMQVFLGRAVVCLCPNVSEFARMYPNVAECIANVCPNVCFASDAALMAGLTWDLTGGIFNSLIHQLWCHQALVVACVGHESSRRRPDSNMHH